MKPPQCSPQLLTFNLLLLRSLVFFLGPAAGQERSGLSSGWSHQSQVDYAGYRTYRGRPRPESRCDTIIKEQEGWIFSPSYPLNYGTNQACSYVIQRFRRDVCKIEITLVDFELEDSAGCYADYFEIPKEKICGSLDPDTKKTVSIPTNGRPLVLRFRSDARNTYKGFTIRLYQIPNSCGRQLDIDYPRSRICDEVITDSVGRITSPGFPSYYGSNQRCTYTIRRSNYRVCRVELYFHRFDLEYGDSCRNDFLELPDRSRLCGTVGGKKSLNFPLDRDQLTLIFQSDRHGSGQGFDIDVEQLTTSCRYEITPGQHPYLPSAPRGQDEECRQKITSYTGRFTSPNYPQTFLPNEHCTYTVWRADSTVCKLELDFQYFDLGQGDASCSRASFQLPDHSLLCHSFSGRKTIEISKNSDFVTFTFNSDQYSYGRGFDIYVKQLTSTCTDYRSRGFSHDYPSQPRNECHQLVTTYYGRFNSPPPTRDRKRVQCNFVIRKADPYVCGAEIRFLRFDIRQQNPCVQDYLSLPDGQRLCGRIFGNKYITFPLRSDIAVMTYYSDYNDGIIELEVLQDRSCYSSLSRSRIQRRIMPRSVDIHT